MFDKVTHNEQPFATAKVNSGGGKQVMTPTLLLGTSIHCV